MSNVDIINMAIRNLLKRKLRTFLTVFGVVIGATSIIVMMSLGIGINESFAEQIEQMGDLTTIQVYRPYDSYMIDASGNTSFQSSFGRASLDDAAIAEFNKIDGVIISTPIMERGLQFISGRYSQYIYIKGIVPEAMQALGYEIEEGRLLESNSSQMEIVFGSGLLQQWQRIGDNNAWRNNRSNNMNAATVDVMNDKITFHYNYDYGQKDAERVRGYTASTTGILKMVEGFNGYSVNYSAFMDIADLKVIEQDRKKAERANGIRNNDTYTGYESALVKCKDIDTVSKVLEVIRDEMGFDAYSQTDYVNQMKEMSGSLQGLLGAIGGVSLFVAAIGIANTMVMSIYERTREIGIMKVIGASIKDIKKLFLLEATLIGFWGGFFGILLSFGVSYVINNVGLSFMQAIIYTQSEGAVSSIPLWLCVLALTFSSLIGLVSGYFPARRAMNLSALNAIKTE